MVLSKQNSSFQIRSKGKNSYVLDRVAIILESKLQTCVKFKRIPDELSPDGCLLFPPIFLCTGNCDERVPLFFILPVLCMGHTCLEFQSRLLLWSGLAF